MAYQVDYITGVVFIPQADLIFLEIGKYKLDLDEFRRKCRDLEADTANGLSYPPIVEYNPVVDTGDVLLARVVLIINGYTVTFEDGQYAVLFDGANTNIHNFTNVNQVSVRPNNSTGLQDLSTLLTSAYQGRVAVNTVKGQTGTSTPIGTLNKPSNNIIDAVEIADINGIGEIYLVNSVDLIDGDDVSGLMVRGSSPIRVSVHIDDGANVYQSEFNYITVSGILDGQSIIRDSIINGLEYVTGFIDNSGLLAPAIVLGAGSQATFNNCFSNVPGTATPTIDMGGAGQTLAIRGYRGGIRIMNRTGSDACSMDIDSGHVVVDASCTGDPITIRGSYKLTVEPGATHPDTDGRDAMANTTATKSDVFNATQI